MLKETAEYVRGKPQIDVERRDDAHTIVDSNSLSDCDSGVYLFPKLNLIATSTGTTRVVNV